MAIFKCKMCGGTIEFEPGATIGVCDSCGTKQTLPRLDDDRRANLYDRANHFRRVNEFDKAASLYEQILNEDTTDAEAYWSLVLCQYGIEYVEDPATNKRVPTVNRTQFTSIFDDDNYKSAIQYADSYQRSLYEEEAAAINEIQKGILAISQKEEPFDIFICYKETDNNGRRTQDSVLATDLYHQLTQEGFKVFFSRITLEDKLGTAYEPYIFAALNSARVMVVLGTKPEHFNAVWVKNEWSRYLSLVKQSGGKKVLIPAYKDMDPYDLPEEFSHLQAQDMSKLGFMQDLIRGIEKITRTDEPKATMKEAAASGNKVNTEPLLKRVFMFLDEGEWDRADDYCEQVLNQDPENPLAYLGKLMTELRVRHHEDLAKCGEPFDNNRNYQKAIRFGGGKLAGVLTGYNNQVKERHEQAKRQGPKIAAALIMGGKEKALSASQKNIDALLRVRDGCLEYSQLRDELKEVNTRLDINERYEKSFVLRLFGQRSRKRLSKEYNDLYIEKQRLNERNEKTARLLRDYFKQDGGELDLDGLKYKVEESLIENLISESALKTLLNKAHQSSNTKYTYEEACKIYHNAPDMEREVNKSLILDILNNEPMSASEIANVTEWILSPSIHLTAAEVSGGMQVPATEKKVISENKVATLLVELNKEGVVKGEYDGNKVAVYSLE